MVSGHADRVYPDVAAASNALSVSGGRASPLGRRCQRRIASRLGKD